MSLSPSLSPSQSRSRSRRRATARPAGLLLLPVVLALGACAGGSGGPDGAATVAPGALASSTTDPTPTPTASRPPADDADGADGADGTTEPATAPDAVDVDARTTQPPVEDDEPEVWATFTAEPGRVPGDVSEAFADDPRLQAVLRFNAEFARAVNADDPQRADWLATLDPDEHEALMDYLGDEFGKTYPGPLPFTPLDIGPGDEDGTASVQGCIISTGFALGAEGFTDTTITSVEYALVEDPAEPDAWLVEAMWAGAYDCLTTDVPARLW